LDEILIAVAALLALVVGPLWRGIQGLDAARRLGTAPVPERAWDWKLTITSALIYALAFNLIFFSSAAVSHLDDLQWISAIPASGRHWLC
jgi:hypothetical protein